MILHTNRRSRHFMAGSAAPSTNPSGPHCPLTRPGVPQPQAAPTWEELLGHR